MIRTIRNFKIAAALALVLSPVLAFARPTPVSAHQRSQPYHDRGTRMHDDRGTTLHH